MGVGGIGGAVLGGVGGFLVGGPVGAAIGAGLGGEIGASGDAATAAGDAANATRDAAIATQGKATAAAAPTPEELLAISTQYSNASAFMGTQINNLQTNFNLLNSTQPALQQAGIQAYQLMTGQEAASLSPIKSQRALARNQLENSLRDRLGSGYNTSSAGSEALNNFDLQTSNLLTNAQQTAISNYLGISAAVMPNMVNLTNSAYGEAAGLTGSALASSNNLINRQVGAINGTAQQVINTAGAPFVSQGIQAQGMQSVFNTAAGAGLSSLLTPAKGPTNININSGGGFSDMTPSNYYGPSGGGASMSVTAGGAH